MSSSNDSDNLHVISSTRVTVDGVGINVKVANKRVLWMLAQAFLQYVPSTSQGNKIHEGFTSKIARYVNMVEQVDNKESATQWVLSNGIKADELRKLVVKEVGMIWSETENRRINGMDDDDLDTKSGSGRPGTQSTVDATISSSGVTHKRHGQQRYRSGRNDTLAGLKRRNVELRQELQALEAQLRIASEEREDPNCERMKVEVEYMQNQIAAERRATAAYERVLARCRRT